QHTVQLQAEVVVQPPRRVLLDDEREPLPATTTSSARLRGDAEVSPAPVLAESPPHRGHAGETAPLQVQAHLVVGYGREAAMAAGSSDHDTSREVARAPADDSHRVFLLSPASSSGERARLLRNQEARFELAHRLRQPGGVEIGEVFSFLSGLYFRGKLGYARAF